MVWDTATGEDRELALGPDETSININKMTFTPDGHGLATAIHQHIKVWELATGRAVTRPQAGGSR